MISLEEGDVIMSQPLPNIGKPAMNAFKSINVTSLEQIAKFSEDELLKLHGVGPKAIQVLKSALSDIGLTFSNNEGHPYQPEFLLLGDLACDNAPKRRVIRDFLVGFYIGSKYKLEETTNQEVEIEINGEQKINSLNELVKHLAQSNVKLSSLNLLNILSHGKYGAAEGVAVSINGEAFHFGLFYTFENSKKEALIKEIRFYVNK